MRNAQACALQFLLVFYRSDPDAYMPDIEADANIKNTSENSSRKNKGKRIHVPCCVQLFYWQKISHAWICGIFHNKGGQRMLPHYLFRRSECAWFT